MNQVQYFNFNQNAIQVINKNGEAWFIASEVAAMLGYRDSYNMTRILDNDEKGTHNVSTLGGNQDVSVINESGFYHAAFKSRKPEVKPFRKWVTSEVLPTIRKTGGYQITPKPTRALPDGLTGEQIEAVKKLHNALTKSAPKEAQARIAITLWSAVKSKFGCSYKEVPAEQFPEVLSVMSRVAVENGVLYGEVLDREPLPAPQPALLDGLDIERFAVTVYYGTWALEMLEEVALPLRQLGHPKATTMHTLWNESRSFLRHNIQALQRVLPALEPDHAAHVRGTLDRLQRLNARFV